MASWTWCLWLIARSATAATSMWRRRRSRSGEHVDVRWVRVGEESSVGVDALVVVDVEEPSDRSPEHSLVGAGGQHRSAGGLWRSDQLLPPS